MKKLFLLAASAMVSFGAFAQSAQSIGGGTAKQGVYPYQLKDKHVTAGKSAQGGSRWYEHYAVVEELYQNMSNSLMPIWFDSTVLQNFTSGLGTINFSSVCQVIDPMYYTLWDDVNLPFVDGSDINVEPWDNYSVDSVFFAGAYVKNLNRSANIVDTLIISVSPTGAGTSNWPYYYASVPGGQAWAGTYVGQTDTIRGFTILDIDSLNRCSYVAGRAMWKVPLTNADRQEDSAGFVDIQTWSLPVMVSGVPGSVNIPAGKGTAVTITFKSGDVWPVNQDTFSEYHHFSLYEGEALGAGQAMPYDYYDYGDRNMSNLMFSTDTSGYYPAVFIEGWNTTAFRQEFHYIGAHIVCASCYALAVNDVNKNAATNSFAYPNPATDEVNVRFSVEKNVNATVSLTNAVGQVIATQNVTAGATSENKATFSTSSLPTGVYFYTIEVEGQRTSGRIAVAH